ncbi:hypothetical protein N7476_001737 [Penicillium atrosanguineum]|uniref:DUF2293 domain-containing protein n=1 Tax=Penicillium atrosanguineum TaxID=1132637 RepID=A0A9W9UE28_9EURO|nr:hypothetical protein N7476_001737 [Penicillium atrosanguineum]
MARTKSKDGGRKKGPSRMDASASRANHLRPSLPDSNDPLEDNIYAHVLMPDGYVFVPKGDSYITLHCRRKTKESHQVVYVIYDKSGKRIQGIRVPAGIHANVVELSKLTIDSRARTVQARDAKYLSHGRKLLRLHFPLMPEESLEVILNHSFLKGSGRVGRTATTTDERKVTLAVDAHIRHKHTSYENLLSSGVERDKARETVWPTVQAIRNTWQEKCTDLKSHIPVGHCCQPEVIVLD